MHIIVLRNRTPFFLHWLKSKSKSYSCAGLVYPVFDRHFQTCERSSYDGVVSLSVLVSGIDPARRIP